MKSFLLTFCLVSGLFSSSQLHSQDSPRWFLSPSSVTYPTGEYVMLPQSYYINPVTQPRVIVTPIATFVVTPSIRVHPSLNQQTEVPLTRHPTNANIMFGSSNATNGLFISEGVYVTTDGGLSWFGSDTLNASGNLAQQRGDPGPTINTNGILIMTHLTSTTVFGGVTGMGASYSTNNGLTWSANVQVSSNANDDKNLATSNDVAPYLGQSYMAWTRFVGSVANGFFSRTTDGGVTWSAPLQLNTSVGHYAQGHDLGKVGPAGQIYVCWTAGIQSSPFTEDYVGFSRSTDGGLTFTTTENIYDVNGSRSASFNGWGIRTNGFPRMDCDRSGGPRNGWIYILTDELNLAPAGSDADVILHSSTNNGVTWSAGVRVNQDALNNGKVQFFPCIRVDEAGNVNVVYYDNRNFPSVGDSCSVYMSTSTDGGFTWADIEVADHHFRPKNTPGLGGGYMGDYLGVTSGNGKVWPFWTADKVSFPVFQAFTTGVTIGPPPPSVINRALRLPTPGVNTNYVAIPHQASMVGFPNITIEGWVKIGGSTTANTVLNHGGLSFDYQLGINAATTNPFFRAQGVIVVANTVTITPLVWTHLAATYDGTTVRFYKDGALAFSQVQAAPLGTSTNEMRIGRGNADPGSGNLEEIRLWIVARTQGQIDSNKCRKYPAQFSSTTGLRALWHFDSTYTDSISSYNGTPTSASVGFDTVSFPPPGANCNLVGITPVISEVPKEYVLQQNYPNPFNPSTTIRFAIPKGEFVEIKLYDLLGREVATLVSDPFEAGTYAVDFDASKLASGVYFYRIEAGEFKDVKKMLLVK